MSETRKFLSKNVVQQATCFAGAIHPGHTPLRVAYTGNDRIFRAVGINGQSECSPSLAVSPRSFRGRLH